MGAAAAAKDATAQVQAREAELAAERVRLDAEWQRLAGTEQELLERAQEVTRLREELEDEKVTMMKLGTCGNDLVGLNFGGERVVTVKRSLLLQFPGSMLAAMFSGRHEERLERDKDGNVFFDYSPTIMVPLIDYLRLHRDSAENQPRVPVGFERPWNSMTDFFGLRAELGVLSTWSGIRTDVKISDMYGWTLFFCKPYSHPTTMEDFRSHALGSSILLLAARRTGADHLAVAAMGNADVITAERDEDTTRLHNGVHWYCRRTISVGFAPSEVVALRFADVHDWSCPLRLSWLLDGNGGWRAGNACYLPNSSEWEKVMFFANRRFQD